MKVKEFGYEYDAVIDDDIFASTKGRNADNLYDGALALRSGRDALKVVAREYENCIALLPALACDSMILPFEIYNHKIEFYKLNNDYSIDIDHLKSIIQSYSYETRFLFLYMDYFGLTSIFDDDLFDLRKDNRIVFVEDRTHNLLVEKTRKFEADYIVASLRKWINVPDGGLIWCNKQLKCKHISEDLSFSEKRLKAQCMRHEYLNCGDEAIKTRFREIFGSVSDIIDEDANPAKMSLYAYEYALKTDWNFVKSQRSKNAKTLIDIFTKANIRLIQGDCESSNLYVPILIDNRTEKQSILSSLGIFNTIIWPLYDIQKDISSVAKYTEEHMLAVSCDQRYMEKDMQFVAEKMVGVING